MLKIIKNLYRAAKNLNKEYVDVNGKEYGPYDWADTVVFESHGKNVFYFQFIGGGKYYFNINGLEYGPHDAPRYSNEGGVALFDDKFGFVYSENFLQYANINGKKYGPYNNIKNIIISENDFGFIYENYVNINDKIYGPYKSCQWLHIKNNKFGFSYYVDNQGYFSINGKIYGPYTRNIDLGLNDNWFGFAYEVGNKFYFNINDKQYGPYEAKDNSEPYPIISSRKGFYYVDHGETFWNIDGKIYNGPEFLEYLRNR
jgi:hypothetical protein